MGVLRKRFSKEEKEEIKQAILDMIEESYATIAKQLGIDEKTVRNYIDELDKEGRISIKAINKEKQKKANSEWERKKALVLKGVHAGITIEEHKKVARIGDAKLAQITQELIDERYNRRWICRKKKKRSKER